MKQVLFFLALLSYYSVVAQSIATKPRFSKPNVYAGIEVGSKGVKMSIIELAKKAKQEAGYTIVKDTSINTDFIAFTPQSFTATLNALCKLYQNATKDYTIQHDRIFTVFSSGVKGQAEKEEKEDWITIFQDSFRLRINEPKRQMTVVNPAEEARLSHIGIVPLERRYTTFLIDIGSGNTKGGYFPNGNTTDFKLFNINWGTKSVQNEAIKRSAGNDELKNYVKQLQRVVNGSVNTDITYAVNVSNAYAMSDYVAISGGIAWSTATLLYPELTNQAVIPVTYDDVDFFVNKLSSSTKPYEAASISKLLEDANPAKQAILAEVNRVHQVFDQRALLSGAQLLLKIMRQFSGIQDKKLFYLVKNGQVGWISAYVQSTKNP